jgi:hypothetical protein
MKKLKAFFITFLGIAILSGVLPLRGQDIPARPDPPRLVNDLAGTEPGTETCCVQ